METQAYPTTTLLLRPRRERPAAPSSEQKSGEFADLTPRQRDVNERISRLEEKVEELSAQVRLLAVDQDQEDAGSA